MWRREPGGRMQTQGRREAEQTLPGAGGVPPPLCEAHRPARTFSRPQDSITVTAGRSAAVGGRGTASRVRGREGDTVHNPPPSRELAALRGADAVTASGVQGRGAGR